MSVCLYIKCLLKLKNPLQLHFNDKKGRNKQWPLGDLSMTSIKLQYLPTLVVTLNSFHLCCFGTALHVTPRNSCVCYNFVKMHLKQKKPTPKKNIPTLHKFFPVLHKYFYFPISNPLLVLLIQATHVCLYYKTHFSRTIIVFSFRKQQYHPTQVHATDVITWSQSSLQSLQLLCYIITV